MTLRDSVITPAENTRTGLGAAALRHAIVDHLTYEHGVLPALATLNDRARIKGDEGRRETAQSGTARRKCAMIASATVRVSVSARRASRCSSFHELSGAVRSCDTRRRARW